MRMVIFIRLGDESGESKSFGKQEMLGRVCG